MVALEEVRLADFLQVRLRGPVEIPERPKMPKMPEAYKGPILKLSRAVAPTSTAWTNSYATQEDYAYLKFGTSNAPSADHFTRNSYLSSTASMTAPLNVTVASHVFGRFG